MNCLVCGERMIQTRDWHYRCASCGLERSTLSAGAGRGIDGLETLRRRNFEIMLDNLSKRVNIKNLKCLEVGCAEGWFIEALLKRGADVTAIEPMAEHARALKNKGFNVIEGFFPDAAPPGRTYDFIAFNDVFEHLPDPVTSLRKCEELLNEGGYLYINLPNANGFIYAIANILEKIGMAGPFERMWQKEFPSPHMSYFSNKTLPAFAKKYSGLKAEDLFYLPSVTMTGLKERIQSTYKGLSGWIIYAGLLALYPVIKIMPQDIMVLVLKKERP